MARRREAQSSTLSFMDCICCGFGAVLLLFILTAKNQIVESEAEALQAAEAMAELERAIVLAEARKRSLEAELAALDPQPDTDTTSLAELAAREERLAREIVEIESQIAAAHQDLAEEPASIERPSADKSYLSGLKLRGPRILILLESTGSMLGEDAGEALGILRGGDPKQADKWLRAKRVLRSVLAAVPKDNEVALFHFNEDTAALSGPPSDPWIDPYDNTALVDALDRLDRLQAGGGSDLARAFLKTAELERQPTSVLVITDSLPTAPAAGGSVTEAQRADLFRRALAVQPRVPINVLLLPFAGDPAAAGLYWQMSGRDSGVTLVPNRSWPPE